MENIKVAKVLGMNEVCSVVEGAVNTCFDDNGEYMAWVKDFAVRQALIRAYTDAEVPSNIQELFTYVYETNLYGRVLSEADTVQLRAVLGAIDEQIEYRIDREANSTKRGLEALVALLQLLSTQMNEFSSGLGALLGDEMKELQNELHRS